MDVTKYKTKILTLISKMFTQEPKLLVVKAIPLTFKANNYIDDSVKLNKDKVKKTKRKLSAGVVFNVESPRQVHEIAPNKYIVLVDLK